MVRYIFVFFNDTATTEIYTLSLHDALPIWNLPKISRPNASPLHFSGLPKTSQTLSKLLWQQSDRRSEEHTSELQSRQYLVCRLLLEKKTRPLTCSTTIPRTCCY